MCYAIPGKVKEIRDKVLTIDYFGENKKALNELGAIAPGDYVYAQGGYVIQKVAQAEAESILKTWEEMFFELKGIDEELSRLDKDPSGPGNRFNKILDKASEEKKLSDEELLSLLGEKDPGRVESIAKTANFLRQKYHKSSCCVHGILEISNMCSRNCSYCGISTHNKSLKRYRMDKAEIMASVDEAVNKYNFKALVLQSGEGAGYMVNELADIIDGIKKRFPVLILISFGEIGVKGLKTLFDAGSRGLLMRFETSNPKLYEELHPGYSLEARLDHIRKAYDMGYFIITGGLVGLPGQTDKDVLNDIRLAKELNAEMFSFGPFIPHESTPLAKSALAEEKDILKALALMRFTAPKETKVLVTTAFETLSAKARERGLLAGANSLMLNATPIKYRNLYSIYPNRAHDMESVEEQIKNTVELLRSLGRVPTDI